MKSVLFDFRTAKEEWFTLAEQHYTKKILNFTDFSIISLKSSKYGREQSELKKNYEASELLKQIHSDDFVILFDETGKVFSSQEFSDQILKIENSDKKRIVFVVGGAYGVNDSIKSKTHLKISLSSFVLNHIVAELVVLEQIYRAHTIKNRIPYHNI